MNSRGLGVLGGCDPSPNCAAPAPSTSVGELLAQLLEMAKNVANNNERIANTLGGAIPSSENCKSPTAGDVIAALQEISGIINNAVCDSNRALRALGA